MKQLALIVGFLLVGGCFGPIGTGPDNCADAAGCPNESVTSRPDSGLLDDPSLDAAGDVSASDATPVVIPAAFAPAHEESPWSDAPDTSHSTQLSLVLNSWGLPFFDAADVDVLVSLLLDDFILDLFTPTPAPVPADDDLPFLERLCREGDTPDFICRQRYGN